MQDTATDRSELLSVFNSLPGLFVLLQPDTPRFTIIAVTEDYLKATFTSRDKLLGKGLFEVFTDNPHNEQADGKQKISQSLERVIRSREADTLHDQRYDIFNPLTNTFEYRLWQLQSEPVLDEKGKLLYIIHQVEDHTGKIVIDASEQAHNIRRLQQSEQQVRAIIESAPFPIGVYTGREMRIQFLNQSIIDVWGKGTHLIGRTYAEVLPELANQHIYEQLDAVYTTGVPLHKRNQRVDLMVDGAMRPFYFNYSFTPLFDDEGQVYGVMNTAADVTDLVLAKQQVEQSERNFRSMILQAPVAMCILLGPEHIVDIANEKIIEIWGKTGETVTGRPVFDVVPAAKNQGFEELLSDVFQQGITHKFDEHPIELFRNNRYETVYLNFVYQPYRDGLGNITGVLAIANEVTEQVLSRRKIEESREELQLAITIADLGAFRVDLINDKAFYTQRIMDWFGLEEQGATMQVIVSAVHEQDRQKTLDALAASNRSEDQSKHHVTYRVVNRKDGMVRHLRSFGKTYFTREGKPQFMVGMIQEITSEVQYRQRLEKNEEELQARVTERTKALESQTSLLNNILLNSSNGISVTEMIRDEAGHILDAATILANDAAVKFTGLPRDVYLSKTAKEIDPHILESEYGKTCIRTLETGEPSVTQYYLQPTGRWLELTMSKMDDDHLIHIFTDVTPIKEAQLRLEHLVEDLKRSNTNLEEFAYAASHDLQEPIRKIHFFSDRLQEELGNALTDRQKHLFQRLQTASDRMRSLIDDLLTYSRVSRGTLEFSDVELDKKLQLVLGDLELQIQEKNAQIRSEPLPVVKGNSRQLQQLFQNVLNNALKYSKDEGKALIDILYKKVKAADVRPELPLEDGTKLFHLITIRDQGIGFRQADAERIFQVFTRLHGSAEYSGTGVGLSIARKVVENHRGYIWAESEPNKGASFFILLPA